MENVIIILILAAIVGGIIWFLYRSKKSGNACIGCPHGSQCAKKKEGGCCCGSTDNENENK